MPLLRKNDQVRTSWANEDAKAFEGDRSIEFTTSPPRSTSMFLLFSSPYPHKTTAKACRAKEGFL